MKYFILFLICMMFCAMSCDNNSIIPPIIPEENKPMWPQYGYDARYSGNPTSANPNIEPIIGFNVNWSVTIPNQHDGESFVSPLIDSRNTCYYFGTNENQISGRLLKIDANGTVLWEFSDSTLVPASGSGMSISKNERVIYISGFTGLYAIDSSGSLLWKVNDYQVQYSQSSKPAIGEDGTIYCVLGDYKLYAISPDGIVKWIVDKSIGNPSIDLDGNVYIPHRTGTFGFGVDGIKKIDKNGIVVWTYSVQQSVAPLDILIDANNNLYFTIYKCQNGCGEVTSLTRDGNVKWIIPYQLGDSAAYYNTYSLTSKNDLIISAFWISNQAAHNGLMAFDTTGTLKWSYSLAQSGFNPIGDISVDSDDNIYFADGQTWGSVTKDGTERYQLGLDAYTILSTNGSFFNPSILGKTLTLENRR